jgi:Cys-rich repeat protein
VIPPPPPDCDPACEDGYECKNGTCVEVEKPKGCKSNSECPEGVCLNGKCTVAAIEGGGCDCAAVGSRGTAGGSAGLVALFGLAIGWLRRRRSV